MEPQPGDERCELFSCCCDLAGLLGALSQMIGVMPAPRTWSSDGSNDGVGSGKTKKFMKKEIFEI